MTPQRLAETNRSHQQPAWTLAALVATGAAQAQDFKPRIVRFGYGLVDNSASPIRLVVLSRLMRSQDDSTLAAVAISPTGLALLAARTHMCGAG